ncbi:hypothetical protein [Acinetobacter haemolyticus]|uniref:Sulfurtransferase complex subunit TusC n=1 Tax=Acinetobacter haemolyticus TaxID=29430 RepID=A0A2K8PZY9_ACIHA|nr:hypothetical protein [Acinetobacter haemolyticus]ATZ67400.1 hypothetical protein BSR56_08530 [Acinetobacter haemolyticus]MCU4378034.1 hypothetical protein [Acinetobacter haemolyticus]MCU4386452.1 hypothetical protein [Acinetobacter haemolyticus]NAR18037.1 hypothetical protein [Acinetobacter haemolyticus]NAR30095.1 hypothetical protein [Acinetobacter haemolyticus]
MKSVLVILTQPNLTSLQINESLSATMVLATFGISVKVLLKDAALSLLNDQLTFDSIQHAFKIASNMVESFEFYDLTPLFIETKNQQLDIVQNSEQEIEFIELNPELIQSFDHVLYW